jgi:serine/threonine protein kinase
MSPEAESFTAKGFAHQESEELIDSLLEKYWDGLRRGQPADPRAWLETQKRGGPELLPRLHLLHLFYRARQRPGEATAVFDGSAPEEAARSDTEVVRSPSLPEGLWLSDQLRILGLLGTGGMGEVYVAWHRTLGCEVAVKVLPPHLVHDPAAVARFRRTIQAQARTGGHEHIVTVMDAGEGHGRLYLVMEYVPGTNLEDYLRQQGPLRWPEACDYMRQAAEGLRHAHARGVVHRDLKPANLMLTPDGKIKILDWGLARWSDQEALTQAGTVLGTPYYISPEQVLAPTRADQRSDLYSLGCTFYYLLTGQPPFAERARLASPVGQEGAVRQALAEQRPDVPAAVTRVVAKLLEWQPERRYASAEALLKRLEKAGKRRPWHRSPWLGAAAVALLVLAAVATWYTAGSRPPVVVANGPRHPDGRALRQEFPLTVTLLGSKLDPETKLHVLEDGQYISFRIEPSQPCYVGVWNITASGKIVQLFPNEADLDNRLPAGQARLIPGNSGKGLRARASTGPEYVHVVASTRPLRLPAAPELRAGPYAVFASPQEQTRCRIVLRDLELVDQPEAVAEEILHIQVRPR